MIERETRSAATASDLELFAHVEANLYTAVLADSLDELGYREQAMNERLRPAAGRETFAGWARKMLCMDVYHVPPEPCAMAMEAVDSILPGEIVVVSTAESTRNAPWGELLSTAVTVRGGRGAIVDGLVGDVKKIQSLGFSLFAAGIKPVDPKGRGMVVDYNCPVKCGGVLVHPGDLIVADFDGVIVVPGWVVTDAVRLATRKVSLENNTRNELMQGAYLRDVYAKYGVL